MQEQGALTLQGPFHRLLGHGPVLEKDVHRGADPGRRLRAPDVRDRRSAHQVRGQERRGDTFADGLRFRPFGQGTVFDPGYWYVTTQEAQWVGWVMHKLGWNNMDNIFFGYINGIPIPPSTRPTGCRFALIGGAAVMALLSNEFKFKKPTLGPGRRGRSSAGSSWGSVPGSGSGAMSARFLCVPRTAMWADGCSASA